MSPDFQAALYVVRVLGDAAVRSCVLGRVDQYFVAAYALLEFSSCSDSRTRTAEAYFRCRGDLELLKIVYGVASPDPNADTRIRFDHG